MKLVGRTDGKTVIASMASHDYISVKTGDDHICVDGGQPGTRQYAGYGRYWGTPIFFEVPQTFGELYTDYQLNFKSGRKYGIWDIKDVKVVDEKDWPDVESFEYKVEQAIWGTRGFEGSQPLEYVHLKDCATDHLLNILNTQNINEDLILIIKYIINGRTN